MKSMQLYSRCEGLIADEEGKEIGEKIEREVLAYSSGEGLRVRCLNSVHSVPSGPLDSLTLSASTKFIGL